MNKMSCKCILPKKKSVYHTVATSVLFLNYLITTPPTYLVHVTLKGANDSSMFSYDKMSIILLDIQKRITCHMQSRDGGNK